MEQTQVFGLTQWDFHRKYQAVWPLFAHIKITQRSKTLLSLMVNKIKYPYTDRFLYGNMSIESDFLIKR